MLTTNDRSANAWVRELTPVVCFRVTRYCNARCGFCLAPPDGSHPSRETLAHRLSWLLAQGVSRINFCGGEPTIHPALMDLIDHVRARRGGVRLTTNGIRMPDDLPRVLAAARAHVKLSVHGDRERHDRTVGRPAYDRVIKNLRRLRRAGVTTSIQTTIVAGGEAVVDHLVGLCLELGVRRLSVMPFIPRGAGRTRSDEYGLSPSAYRALRDDIKARRRVLTGRLDLRWLDFSVRPLVVVEADGRVVVERETESVDTMLGRIPVA